MIPSPNEPKNINPYLNPLVEDFKALYDGISFQNPATPLGYTNISAVLACVACDLPATVKSVALLTLIVHLVGQNASKNSIPSNLELNLITVDTLVNNGSQEI